MIITEGKYRGTEISLYLMPGTSGQVQCSIKFEESYWKAHMNVVKDEEIRKIFNLPEKDNDLFSFHNLFIAPEESNKCEAILWNFNFGNSISKYEFLAYVFRGIDKIASLVLERCPYPKCQFKIESVNPEIGDEQIAAINNKLNEFAEGLKWPYKHESYDVHMNVLMALKSNKLTNFIDVKPDVQKDGTVNYIVKIEAIEINNSSNGESIVPSILLPLSNVEIKCTSDKLLNEVCDGAETNLYDQIYKELDKIDWPYEHAEDLIRDTIEKFLGEHIKNWNVEVTCTGASKSGACSYLVELVDKISNPDDSKKTE